MSLRLAPGRGKNPFPKVVGQCEFGVGIEIHVVGPIDPFDYNNRKDKKPLIRSAISVWENPSLPSLWDGIPLHRCKPRVLILILVLTMMMITRSLSLRQSRYHNLTLLYENHCRMDTKMKKQRHFIKNSIYC